MTRTDFMMPVVKWLGVMALMMVATRVTSMVLMLRNMILIVIHATDLYAWGMFLVMEELWS